MSYTKGNETWEGVVPDENHEYLQCEICGSKEIKMVAHFDGRDVYGYNYNCGNGHPIRQIIPRKPKERWY